jgi:hypothetical protein
MNEMNLVSVTPALDLEIKQNSIKAQIITRLTELKLNEQRFKVNPDIILLGCNLIENLVKNKKINKKQLLLDVFNHIYALQPEDLVIVDSQIEFLHSTKAIKKLSGFYLFCCSVREYFFKSKKKEN